MPNAQARLKEEIDRRKAAAIERRKNEPSKSKGRNRRVADREVLRSKLAGIDKELRRKQRRNGPQDDDGEGGDGSGAGGAATMPPIKLG